MKGDNVIQTLAQIKRQIKKDRCEWCNYSPLSSEVIKFYEHTGGWMIDGIKKRVWLFITCPKCDYEWALWKLGVPRK